MGSDNGFVKADQFGRGRIVDAIAKARRAAATYELEIFQFEGKNRSEWQTLKRQRQRKPVCERNPMFVVCIRVALWSVFALLTSPAFAADAGIGTQVPSAPAITVGNQQQTLKERLGDKASDEQRVDNCKVPPERRGAKIRPDNCDHAPTSAVIVEPQ